MIDINDSELLKIEKINNWAADQQGKSMNVDQFTKDLAEKFNEIGFTVEVKVYDTTQKGVYGFEVDITGRTLHSFFDPDRQVHEVVNNILEIPGQDTGFIKTKDAAAKLLSGDMSKGKHNH